MCRGLIFSMVSILFAFVDGCGIAHQRRKIYGCFLTSKIKQFCLKGYERLVICIMQPKKKRSLTQHPFLFDQGPIFTELPELDNTVLVSVRQIVKGAVHVGQRRYSCFTTAFPLSFPSIILNLDVYLTKFLTHPLPGCNHCRHQLDLAVQLSQLQDRQGRLHVSC